ncbi:VWA domain-containing protein [Thermochromatium tepidum]|uniref:VWA domain-containing protein n=1 Tax=Thermochromatium tepidum ATCC 43061 TaxID=316276 RepID=A0A6I6EJ17_THETI|nr:VWA domain-containing protein [Thermochromatium tepidum]QGU33117.1 VWA domain-containing protein [Thermochromatium tepidum ATCC 43061]
MLFLRPLWFLALIPIAWLLWRLWHLRASAEIWSRVVDPHLLPPLLVGEGERAHRWPLVLLGVGWLILVVALAGPAWRQLPQPVFSLGARSVILLDLSPSLDATDVPPSRLGRARFETLDLLEALREGQVGLIAFGPEPFVVSPLTADANTIAAQVPLLATDLVPVPGSRRTDRALERAGELLRRAGGGAGHVILITDGVGNPAGSLESARRLAEAGHRLSVLAVGTLEGAPVPRRGGGFEQDGTGALQIARLERDRLRELARVGEGRYLEASVGTDDTQALIAAAPRPERTIEASSLTTDRWREEGPWLILLLLPLAALAFRRGWLVPVLAAVLLIPPDPALAFGWDDLWWRADQQGMRELAAGRPDAAAERFSDPAWRAAAHYRAGRFQQALDALDGLTGVTAEYNRGNALARLGRLEEAAAAYERVLQQDPNQSDARHNLELVRRLLDQSSPRNDRTQNGQSQDDPSGKGQKSSSTSEPSDTSKPKASEPGAQEPDAMKPDASESSETKPNESQGASQNRSSEPDAEADSSPSRERAEQTETKPDAAKLSPEDSALDDRPAGPDSETRQRAGAKPTQAKSDESPNAPRAASAGPDHRSPEEREREQVMEARLRQVPDDPAGLLRQRFLLQHLRREGQ